MTSDLEILYDLATNGKDYRLLEEYRDFLASKGYDLDFLIRFEPSASKEA